MGWPLCQAQGDLDDWLKSEKLKINLLILDD